MASPGAPPVEIQVQATGPHGLRGGLFFARSPLPPATLDAVTDTSPPDAKRALRAELLARRRALPAEDRRERSRAIAARLEALEPFRAARTVALYAPLGAEVDATLALPAPLARGATVLFPRAAPGSLRLAFARCAPVDLVRGPFGALEPPVSAPDASPDEIDCVLMPGVAFSEDGLRLGRGGGHYDATLAAMPRAFRVGLAFDVQIVPSLPREPHDAALDAVVTETRTLVFRRPVRARGRPP